MPQLSHPAALALVAAAALLLSGCTGDTPVVLPSPQSSIAPVFASDEEALAAAEDAYGRYLAASDAINAKNGEDPQTIAPFVHSDFLPEVLEEFESFESRGLSEKGNLSFDSATLQQYEDNLADPARISVYVCVDASKTRVIDEKGNDVTSPDRRTRIPLEVTFETEERLQNLLILSSDVWSGEDFCAA